MNYKDIHIGELIKKRFLEQNIETARVCNYFNCSEEDITKMYLAKNLSTEIVLSWSKLLEYDFFRLYSQHLILYAPVAKLNSSDANKITKSQLPQFRKNIYTKEVIYFILELLEQKEKTIVQIIEDYNIPKTTLYKWIRKYRI